MTANLSNLQQQRKIRGKEEDLIVVKTLLQSHYPNLKSISSEFLSTLNELLDDPIFCYNLIKDFQSEYSWDFVSEKGMKEMVFNAELMRSLFLTAHLNTIQK